MDFHFLDVVVDCCCCHLPTKGMKERKKKSSLDALWKLDVGVKKKNGKLQLKM